MNHPHCIPVGPSLAARCRAIRQVIQPGQVRDYAEAALRHNPWRHRNAVDAVACYLLQLKLVYIADPARRDNWCPPRVTVQRGGGDCDDFAVLAASMLRAAGAHADVVLGWWRQPSGRGYHAWVAGVSTCGVCRFVLEPQNGQLWWNETPADRDAQYLLGPERCVRVDRNLRSLS
ncbi:MAG: transglutaminase domain-containing protein [Myxococcales bacterium]|nr:transglutaminase domain-containing protein [Myxococcales bacterium]